MKTTILACTYNQPRELEICLDSICKQSTDQFDIVIADDGSGPETAHVVKKYKQILGERLTHVWHEDNGYQKSQILNKAIAKLNEDTEWVIFIDTDTLLHPQFVEDHISQKSLRGLFMGRRVELNESLSQWIRLHPQFIWKKTHKNSWKFSSEFYQELFVSAWQNPPTQNFNRSFRIENSILRKLFKYDHVPDLLGSNFSICAKLLRELGGFNQNLKNYWGEDGDLFIRALEAGVKPSGRKCWALQFHLWHPRRPYAPEAEENYQMRIKNLNINQK